MENYQHLMKWQHRIFKWSICLLITLTLISMAHPVLVGLLLGASVSYINLWLLQKETEQLVRIVEGNKRFILAGTISRIGAALLVVVLSLRFPEAINLYAVIIGLMLKYVIVLGTAFFVVNKD
ncbi:ATP synthase protein I [Streptohalobacillus salinus]|uniref:ATP synthase protein I n=1 Tax=Streptohalobacillus salinus TaxID=621096 RepID=A0A2V3WBW8_9BACI|nr:ATP synthase subunit I [Streptohalobacillus salinus]PXW92049.1 ATP synthase protein I [Streptohalobacillus salinus]